jgi:hypothetical protein
MPLAKRNVKPLQNKIPDNATLKGRLMVVGTVVLLVSGIGGTVGYNTYQMHEREVQLNQAVSTYEAANTSHKLSAAKHVLDSRKNLGEK